METAIPIDSLTWTDIPCPLSEVLVRNRIPSLVRVQEGYCGIDDTCTFENDQHLFLHTLRTRQNFIAEDSVGKRIAIPVECETELLVCPSSIYCTYDPIRVCEISNVYPDVKYFRVIQNIEKKRVEKYFELGSIFEVEYVDSTNSHVKFKCVKRPLPFSCGIVFEALLDYREYTLKEAVKEFGLPIKVSIRINCGYSELFSLCQPVNINYTSDIHYLLPPVAQLYVCCPTQAVTASCVYIVILRLATLSRITIGSPTVRFLMK